MLWIIGGTPSRTRSKKSSPPKKSTKADVQPKGDSFDEKRIEELRKLNPEESLENKFKSIPIQKINKKNPLILTRAIDHKGNTVKKIYS